MAAGSGSRMGASVPKQFLKIGDGGLTILETSIRVFEACEAVDEILVVSSESFLEKTRELAAGYSKVYDIVCGGKLRQDSVRNGLASVAASAGDEAAIVLVHDAARPFVTQDVITSVIESANKTGAAVPVVPVKDTIRMKMAGGDEEIRENELGTGTGHSAERDSAVTSRTLPRETLFSVQTPQGFDLELLRTAYDKAYADGFVGTDDAGIVEYAGHAVSMCQGEYANIKITTKEDLPRANSTGSLDAANENSRGCSERNSKEGAVSLECGFSGFRIGHGYDVHQLVEGRKLILCGVDIPHELGLLGHSDADVALHALMDAMLGAAALGDIGKHFPDSDERYKGISSMLLLAEVRRIIQEAGYAVGNVDVTIIAQRPKLAPHIQTMRENVAKALDLELDAVSIKATTTEKLGFTGRGEGIASEAVCLLYKA